MRTYLSLLILSAVFLLASCASEQETGDEQERPTPIAGYELAPRDMSRIVQVSAVTEPENIITIASRMSGLITGLSVREGDRVNQGDVLVRFDIDEHRAELKRAEAELELAEARFERNEQLFEREVISSADFEESRANKRIAESEVQLLETRIGFGTLRAPADIIVLERHVEQGEAVATNEPLLRVADLNRLVVRVGIPERDIVNLETGQHVELRIDAWPGEDFEGAISRIYPSADSDSRLITVEISLETSQNGRNIRPGFLARAAMTADRREGVLAVPSESLLASGRDERFVYIINDDGRLERRDVETGIERRNWTLINSGLEEGDVVVGANPSNLREDILVEVTRWIDGESTEMAQR